MDDQRVFHGTDPTLSSLAAHVGDDQTALFIIGEVAALGRELAWFGEKPAYEVAA